jgi:hypothetical protein
LERGLEALPQTAVQWQGHVFAVGDFLTVWAVENVVHQLDLASETPAPASALVLARATIEALAEALLPTDWTDEDAILIGTGRHPVPTGSEGLA